MVTLLQACGGGGGGSSQTPSEPPPTVAPPPAPDPDLVPPPITSGLLISPAEAGDIVDAVTRRLRSEAAVDTDGLITSPAIPAPSPVASPSPGEQSDSFSTGYRLEEEVGELDIVGYDGDRLVIAPSRSSDCCLVVTPSPALPEPPPTSSPLIRILETNPDAATATDVGTIELASGEMAEGLFFDGDELSVITSSAWWGSHGTDFAASTPWEGQSTSITIYDIANPSAPVTNWQLTIEGALVAGRKVGDQILLVTRHYPRVEGLQLGSSDADVIASNLAILDALVDEDVIPNLLIDGVSADELQPADCLLIDADHPQAPQESGFPVMTSMVWVDAKDRVVTDITCIAETVEGVYVNANSVFLAQSVAENQNLVETIVHRFDLSAEIDYRGSGRVDGGLNNRGQADFRMSASGETLRLVTTQFTGDSEDQFNHRLITLGLSESVPVLETLSLLPANDSEPQLGKPNEDIFGVRFLGDRAYLVTFEVIDPLIIVDMADPMAPQVIGELEIPGFSDLLVPVSEDLLLGLGEDGERRLKLELFDISIPSEPSSRGIQLLGDDGIGAYSNARYDRRALSFLPGAESDRVAVPVSLFLESEETTEVVERLYMLTVQNKLDPSLAELTVEGIMEVKGRTFTANQPRVVIDQEAVFFVLADEVWSSFWGSSDVPAGPF